MLTASAQASPKSYPVAVCLAAIFGIMGIHHFYTGRILLGLCDLGLFVATVVLYVLFEQTLDITYGIWALVLLIVDILHTIFVTVRLLIGVEHDGQGRVIAYPSQKLS